MRRVFCHFFIILVMYVPGLTAGDDLFSAFPGLEKQVAANLQQGMDHDTIVSRLEEYCGTNDPEMVRGMRMILAGDSGKTDESNFALQLLLFMLDDRSYAPGDTMALAMALVNNRLYSTVNDEIREEIRRDLSRHYGLYRTIVAWQKKFEMRIDLSRMPLVPKMYWADRMVYPPEGISYPVRTLDDYREYVDTIETLEYFHDLADRHRLYEGGSVKSMGDNVYAFIHKKDDTGFDRDFYGPTPEQVRPFIDRIPHDSGYDTVNDRNQIMYRGKWSNINGFIYTNYQRKLYQGLGRFIGLCEVFSLTEMAMFKAMGIPSGLMIRNSPPGASYGGHVFAMYYDPFRTRWNNLELIRKSDKPWEMNLVIGKPVWHHRVKALKGLTAEKEMAPRYFRLLELGIQEKHFDRIFFSERENLSGIIFSRAALPDELTDSDGDTLYDFEEKLMGLDPRRADTAGDGVADLWKLMHGLDPKEAVADLELPPVDGLGGGYRDTGRLVLSSYGPYDGKSLYDEIQEIKTLSAARFGDTVYVSVSFHNDISRNKSRGHYLTFTMQGGRGNIDSFEVLIDSNNPRPANANARAKSPDGFKDIRGWAIRDVELSIPVRYMDGADTVTIHYRGFVRKDGKKTDNLKPGELILQLR